jgi:glycosyltransferase involved in cell wall biosynthesis
MASGCVCIVADTGGLREVVPPDGRFPSSDAGALGALLERALTDEDARAQTVAAARAHVLRFDWGEVARRTADVYESLVAADTRRPQGAGAG